MFVICFISQWIKRSRHSLFVFPPKKTLIWRKHYSIGQSCCSMTSKRSIGWFLSDMKFFHPSVRSTNQKPRAFVCFFRAFSFHSHTKIALKTNHCASENHLWNSQSVYENPINFHLKTSWNCKIFTTRTRFQSVITFSSVRLCNLSIT